MSKNLKHLMLLTLCLALLASSTVMAAPTVKFGLVAPFTGMGSILGQYIREAMMMAVNEINEQGGINGSKIEVIIYDTEAAPATTINVVKRIIENDKVDVLFGPNMSSGALAVHQVAQENEVLMLVGATSPSLRYTNLNNPWLFRLRADDQVKVDIQVEYAVNVLGVKKPGVIYGTTDYCTSAKAVLEAKFAEYGIPVVAAAQIREGDKDATGQLSNLLRAGVDSVMGLTHEPEGAVVVRQMRQMGMDVPVIGFSAWGVPAFTDLAAEAATGVIAVQGFTPEDPNPKVQEFANKYRALYGRFPSDPGQAYYDGVYIMADIIGKVGLDRKAMRDELATYSGFVGLQGEIVADEYHNLSRFSIVSQFNGEGWDIIEVYE